MTNEILNNLLYTVKNNEEIIKQIIKKIKENHINVVSATAYHIDLLYILLFIDNTSKPEIEKAINEIKTIDESIRTSLWFDEEAEWYTLKIIK